MNTYLIASTLLKLDLLDSIIESTCVFDIQFEIHLLSAFLFIFLELGRVLVVSWPGEHVPINDLLRGAALIALEVFSRLHEALNILWRTELLNVIQSLITTFIHFLTFKVSSAAFVIDLLIRLAIVVIKLFYVWAVEVFLERVLLLLGINLVDLVWLGCN